MKIVQKLRALVGTVAALALFAASSQSVAEILQVKEEKLSSVEGQFLVSALVGTYIVKEILVGEIIGEAVSIREDVTAKINLLDAVRPNNDTGLVGDAVKRTAVVASVGGAAVAATGGVVAGGAVVGTAVASTIAAFILGGHIHSN